MMEEQKRGIFEEIEGIGNDTLDPEGDELLNWMRQKRRKSSMESLTWILTMKVILMKNLTIVWILILSLTWIPTGRMRSRNGRKNRSHPSLRV